MRRAGGAAQEPGRVGARMDRQPQRTSTSTRGPTVLWETNERLASALRAGRMMAWDWNLVTGRVTRSDTSLDVLGLPSGEIDGFLDRIPEEDRAAYLAAFEAAARGDGRLRRRVPVPQAGRADRVDARDRAGRLRPRRQAGRARGLVFDISERKQAEESPQESERPPADARDDLPGVAYRCRNEPRLADRLHQRRDPRRSSATSGRAQDPAAPAGPTASTRRTARRSWNEVQEAGRRRRPRVHATGPHRGRRGAMGASSAARVRRANGRAPGARGFISDITERRRIEERLRQSPEDGGGGPAHGRHRARLQQPPHRHPRQCRAPRRGPRPTRPDRDARAA